MNTWKRTSALYLTSQGLSLFGSSLVQYALMWTLTLQTKSGIVMMLYILAGFVPTFLLAPFGGVWADRYDRKKLMIIADGSIALATLVLALVLLFGSVEIWLFFVIAAIRALGTAIHQPAASALIPQFVPQDKLTRVNGIMGTMQSVLMFLAPVLSGLLLSLVSLEVFFFVDVATAILAIAVLVVGVRVTPHARAAGPLAVSYLTDMKLGFDYIRKHRYLVPFFAFMAVVLFLVAPAAFLTPLQVARTFGADVWRLTGIEIVFSVGMMIGGAAIASWGGFKNRMTSMVFATSLMAVCTILLGVLTGNYWIYLIPMGVFGIGLPFYNTAATVMIQEHVEQEYMGRVFSVMTMLMTSMMPLGMLLFGPLAELVSIEILLVASGGAILLASLLILMNRGLFRAGMPPAPAELGAEGISLGPAPAD